MRHAKKRLQLNRFTSLYKATLRSLARNLLIHQSIRTSLSKAKAARPLAERLITLAKANTLAAKRGAYKILGDHKLVSLLFSDIGPRFEKYQGGYTRIINLGQRRGDGSALAILELTEIKKKEAKKPKKEKEPPVAPEKPVEELKEKPAEKKKPGVATEKPPITKKPTKGFLKGIRSIFKKERDSL